jgi:hypothetical protein
MAGEGGDRPPIPPGSKLRYQEPGKMGLGTSDQKMEPKPGWTPPKKPDLLTRNVRSRRGKT